MATFHAFQPTYACARGARRFRNTACRPTPKPRGDRRRRCGSRKPDQDGLSAATSPAPGEAVPLHPEAFGFATTSTSTLRPPTGPPAHRPTGNGRVEDRRSSSATTSRPAPAGPSPPPTRWPLPSGPGAAGGGHPHRDPQDPPRGHRGTGGPGSHGSQAAARDLVSGARAAAAGMWAKTAWPPSTATTTHCRPPGQPPANRSG